MYAIRSYYVKKGDTLIVCGDFGFIWSGDKREDKVLKRLGRKKYNILFVEGCHENFELLYKYPQEDWNGGKVRAISGRLKQLVRGSVFNIEGKKIFAFGGGQGVDHDIRKSYKTFWEEELPTDEELQNGLENLKSNRITSYNVCYTKLLRKSRILRTLQKWIKIFFTRN